MADIYWNWKEHDSSPFLPSRVSVKPFANQADSGFKINLLVIFKNNRLKKKKLKTS